MPEEKCPQCGAIGKNDKEHSAAARQSDRGSLHIVDLGWKCWHCGFEWGFQLPESKKARHDEIVLDFVIRAYFTAYGSFAGFSEWLDSPLSREERNVAYCLADDYAGDLGYERYGVQMIVRCENHSRCLSSVEKTEIRPCYHSVPHYQNLLVCSTMSCSEAPAGNQCTCLEVSLDEAITWKLTHDPFRNNEGGSI